MSLLDEGYSRNLVVGTTLDIYVFITEDSDIEDLLQSTGDYITASTSLSKGTIQIKQCTDANRDNPAQVRTRVGLGGGGKQSCTGKDKDAVRGRRNRKKVKSCDQQ
jgi:hypothetical protein